MQSRLSVPHKHHSSSALITMQLAGSTSRDGFWMKRLQMCAACRYARVDQLSFDHNMLLDIHHPDRLILTCRMTSATLQCISKRLGATAATVEVLHNSKDITMLSERYRRPISTRSICLRHLPKF